MGKARTDPLIGQVIDGRYEVVSRIARGGMAGVYLARDLRLERDVALKILHPHLADSPDFVERFRREARSAAKLVHPGIVGIYDQGTFQEAPYLVMEYVNGPTLRTILATRGAPPLGKALDLMANVLDALGAAHRSGIVHRDVKPENVLIGPDSQVKVADFGLARAVTEVTAASSGVVLGTVAYLSPELVGRGVADERTDIYSAGVMLYELLTGSQPFTGDAPIQIAFQHVNSAVPAPSKLVPWLPPAVDALMAHLTAKDPDNRPADGSEALRLLRQVRERLDPKVVERVPAPPHAPTIAVPTAQSPPRRTSAMAPRHSIDSTGTQVLGASALRESLDDDAPPASTSRPPARSRPAPQEPTRSRASSQGSAHSRSPSGRPKRRRGRGAAVAVIVLLLLVGGAGAGWYWYDNYGPGSFVAVPSVAGKAQGEAEAAIAHADLLANVTEEWNDTVPEGQVIRSDPEASVKIRPGGPVNLVISQGVRYETVPDGIEGAAAADAEQILLNAQLDGKIDQSETFHDDVAEGLVISISPGSGEEVRHDTDFTMLVSLGREPVRVPRLDGLTVKQARSAVENAGLEFKQTGESYSESVPEGEILSQDPQPGPGQFRGDQVSVTVSKGREPILIPEVADLPVDEARDILGRAGFEVDVQSVTPPETAPLNRAVATDPPGGEYGYLGDRITLTVV